MFVEIVGVSCLNVGGVPGATHFHQSESSHSHQHERDEAEQKRTVDGEDCGRQHHQESEDSEGNLVAFAPQGEHPHHDAEQSQMYRGRQKCPGENEVIGCEEDEIGNGERRRPALGNHELTTPSQ